MSAFIVHSIPGSPFARSVMATLEEKGASWTLVPLTPGTLRDPVHLQRHPFGRMPVLDHGGFQLYETQAILRYLDRVLPEPALTPADAHAAARMDQVMNINDWYLFQGCSNIIVFQRVIGPMLMDLEPDLGAIAEAMPRAKTVFGVLARLLGDKPWFAGDQLTLADLLVGPQLELFARAPEWEELVVEAPNLTQFLARIEARPAMQLTRMERLAALKAA
ncbi:MAG TPA: glutathione S-transferase family protein [Sphingomicrobium sp.]|nr:glutathione S-transferase family protein [Sphingomicrobium sp.]